MVHHPKTDIVLYLTTWPLYDLREIGKGQEDTKIYLGIFQKGYLLVPLQNISDSNKDLEHFNVSDWVLHCG